MDTPEKAPIGTPVPKFEDSPFSNFINNLSPINPSKTMNTSLTLGSLNFASPPSVFTSPHIGLQRESRFIRRHQLTDLAKLDLSSKNENNDSINEDGRNVSYSTTNSTNEVTGLQTSKDEGFSDPSHDASDLIVELSMELKYDCRSPTLKTEPGTSSCIPLLKESSSNVDGTGATEHTWDNLVDFLAFESPQDPATLEEHTKQSEDEEKDLLASLIIFPEDDANDLAQDQQDLSNDPVRQPNEATKLNQIHHMQDDTVNPLTGSATRETSKKIRNKLLMHQGVRRRCLVFEIQGAREDVNGSQDCTSSSSLEGDNILSNNTHPTLRQRGDSLIGVRPGIGLHLNAIAKGYNILKPENCPEKKSVTSSSDSSPSPCIGSESFKTSASISSEDNGIVENELLNASAFGADDDTIPSSPRKKRRLPENNGEDEACKRCNCKKSKCLKLYCECFAAGVYCAGPCACQDCFNQPIHEETVLATRKLIESRNPLAFAPKVVKGVNLANDLQQDESNRTPASARHKRGCNCKKSNCLKKYCECFQGGAGCSIGCRCEGCRNTFGRRDRSILLGMELAVEQDTPRKHIDQDLNPISTLPDTPLRLFRSSLSLPSSSNLKHPRLQGITSCSLLSRDGQGRSTFLRTEHKNEDYVEEFPSEVHISTSPSPKRIKSLSPNSKRISPPQSGNSDELVRSSRKLILQSIPSFPSLTPRR